MLPAAAYLQPLAAVTLSPSTTVLAQAYPAKPVRWIVPYPAGGGSDFLARTVGAQMEKQLGQPLVIENRPGAATMIGAEAVARGTADGYTLLSGDNGTFVFNTALYKKVPYDPAKDFAPVGLMARFPLIVVANPSTGFKTMRDLVDAAKKEPGQAVVRIGRCGQSAPSSDGADQGPHRRIHRSHSISRRRAGGAGRARQSIAGDGDRYCRRLAAHSLGQAGAARCAEPPAARRIPNVPTLEEQGIRDTEVYAWQGMAVPAATPRDVTAKLSSRIESRDHNA